MADLRERLEAAILCLSLLDKEGVKLTSTIATLREVLAHPEKLMGEPVGWRLKTGHGTRLVEVKPECEVDFWVPVYAPEVKP